MRGPRIVDRYRKSRQHETHARFPRNRQHDRNAELTHITDRRTTSVEKPQVKSSRPLSTGSSPDFSVSRRSASAALKRMLAALLISLAVPRSFRTSTTAATWAVASEKSGSWAFGGSILKIRSKYGWAVARRCSSPLLVISYILRRPRCLTESKP